MISPSSSRRIGLAPIPIYIAIIAVLDIILPSTLAPGLAYNPLVLFASLQTVFLFGTSCIVAYVSLKSYLSGGSRTILLLGSAALAWGFASFLAGLVARPSGWTKYCSHHLQHRRAVRIALSHLKRHHY